MRLLVTLRSLKNAAYDLKYGKLRGFLYGLQQESATFNRHDLKGYKFFCFSNIFPPKDMKCGETRRFIVSCPNPDFIYWMSGRLTHKMQKKETIHIGEYQFLIDDVRTFQPKIGQQVKITTGTPLVIRIPSERYKEYGITSVRPYEYWKPSYDLDAFLKQLNDNIAKKYQQYFGKKVSEHLLQELEFTKDVCVHHVEDGKEVKTVGTLWTFNFNHLNTQQQKILEFALDAGFGELNSSGFGFVSVGK